MDVVDISPVKKIHVEN
ncbi:unnamed protein product [Macrosiphum euphorbiae]|uniref:Uncharacterized protein n=1 Tax=Macrosiphum euphorbiae TaxID=13131 RepID=A0AAV0WE65_9HEMI|nr:unnamed protein product [Macrosiphum euphorbiae]